MNNFELRPTEKKDHYRIFFNGVDYFGELERSVVRHMIEVFDNGINVGL
jgi:hypothetical protein